MKKSDHLPDIVREVQTEIESFHSMLEASVIAAWLKMSFSIASKCHNAVAFPRSLGLFCDNKSSMET